MSKDQKYKIKIVNGYPQIGDLAISKTYLRGGIYLSREYTMKALDEQQAKDWRQNPEKIPQEIKNYFESQDVDVKYIRSSDVAQLRSKSGLGYTWHESEDLHTGYLVKSEIHASIAHEGGHRLINEMAKQNNFATSRPDLYNAIKELRNKGE